MNLNIQKPGTKVVLNWKYPSVSDKLRPQTPCYFAFSSFRTPLRIFLDPPLLIHVLMVHMHTGTCILHSLKSRCLEVKQNDYSTAKYKTCNDYKHCRDACDRLSVSHVRKTYVSTRTVYILNTNFVVQSKIIMMTCIFEHYCRHN